MYKVFLSSTSRDLQAYRDAVRKAIAGLDGFEVVGMEDFSARDAAPKAFCVRLVGESDVLVGLLGHYYGSCPPLETTSFSEIEYRTARDAGRPRLMFVAPDGFLIPANLRESDASFECQQRFRQEVMAERVVASFATPVQLASAVTQALANWREEQRQAREAAATGLTEAPTHFAAAVEAENPLGPNPYRGLEAFRKEDADRFFGREALIEKLWQAFIALHGSPADGEAPVRLLTILGPSGSGKSSVAQAGLLAALDERPLPGRPAVPSAVFTPDARPLESLAAALARQATGDPAPAQKAMEFEKVLRERPEGDGLRFLAAQMLGRAGIVLLVDQFEETYALCQDHAERNAFIDNLLNAARAANGRVSIILTLRSDFLGAVNQHPELSSLIARQNVVVPVMREEELRRAIEKPAWDAGHAIDPDTVHLLLEQTCGREGALPLLEFVLTRVWEGFASGIAAAVTVSKLGGVGGALATGAQDVYETLNDEEREIAQRAFLAMVRFDERTKYTKRRARLSEMLAIGQTEDRVLRVLRHFAGPECRLVTLADAGGATTAEVAHEALFDHWHLLREWLDTERDDLRFKRGLATPLLRFLKTSTFRLALMYLALFGVSALALLGFLYVATAGVLERQTQDTIQAEITGLREQYRTEGLTRLREVIEQRSAADPQRDSDYLLVDPLGQRIAGNLDRWPDVKPSADGWLTFTVEIQGERRRARAASFNLAGGSRLLVGREIERRLRIQSLIKTGIGLGLTLILLLGLAGGFGMSLGMLRRVDGINRTIRRIMTGELGLRIAPTGSRDEFDQLAANINAMLDELERLHPRNPDTRRTRGTLK
jgi:HAMP domain-containing protein